MMNIRSLDSKESVGVKYNTAYASKCVQSSDLKATGVTVILLSQDKQSSRLSLHKVSSEAAVCICYSK